MKKAADFISYGGNSNPTKDFWFSDFHFISLGSPDPVVRDQSGERALSIVEGSLTIEFPIPANIIMLRLGFFNRNSILCIARDASGASVYQKNLSGANGFYTFTLGDQWAVSVELQCEGKDEMLRYIQISG